ncbi:hypothetical protein G6F71_007647 [Rhizopus microsporus]|nr:hypothetical protein G6F71_007647 [Rhizopus microsporus]KAG1260940.1 hypothetical protein G6F68_007061 [Rhizopus microsporus]
MSNNKNIPYEVLRQIFKHAVKNLNNAQHWLAQYQLVCKSWAQAARDCLYISVKFDDYLVLMDFIHSMQNWHELSTPVPDYSDYIHGCKLHHELAMDNRSTPTRIERLINCHSLEI